FLKIAPDLVEAELEDIAAEVIEKKIDGVVVSNTTPARVGLRSASLAGEVGGLSGKPLFERSTAVLARMRKLLGPRLASAGLQSRSAERRAHPEPQHRKQAETPHQQKDVQRGP
ncbi:MAG: hypothetical protein EOQ83_02290, partial [Mesorhizobium sp.]